MHKLLLGWTFHIQGLKHGRWPVSMKLYSILQSHIVLLNCDVCSNFPLSHVILDAHTRYGGLGTVLVIQVSTSQFGELVADPAAFELLPETCVIDCINSRKSSRSLPTGFARPDQDIIPLTTCWEKTQLWKPRIIESKFKLLECPLMFAIIHCTKEPAINADVCFNPSIC